VQTTRWWKCLATALIASAVAVVGLLPASAGTPSSYARRDENETSQSRRTAGDLMVSVPAGPLTLSMSGNEVVLRRRPGNGNTTRYEGTLPRVRVTDTRAQLLGWLVQISFAAPSSVDASSARLYVHPNRPTLVSGDASGVRKGRPDWTDFGSQVSLFSAEQGAGRGTYTDDATIVLVVPRSDAPSVTLMFGASAY
jgi:hypothetical protein